MTIMTMIMMMMTTIMMTTTMTMRTGKMRMRTRSLSSWMTRSGRRNTIRMNMRRRAGGVENDDGEIMKN